MKTVPLFLGAFAIWMALSCLQANAQDNGIIVVSKLEERLANTARITGQIVASFHTSGRPSDKRPIIQAYVPGDWAGKIVCLNLVSDDGLYEAKGSYRVAGDWPGGSMAVPLQSQHEDYLRKIDREHFASRLTKGKCDTPAKEFTVTSWNERLADSVETTNIFINSMGADEVYLIIDGGTEVDCTAVQEVSQVAFDHSCSLPASKSGRMEVEINRIRRGTFDPPLTVLLYRGD
jgi:hypothetical protein